ncbi:MAG: hypothetical protein FWC59_01070, partial [Actinomycetia bacterium]|nr:hypothetical protein [Actinomycetes bacterium]
MARNRLTDSDHQPRSPRRQWIRPTIWLGYSLALVLLVVMLIGTVTADSNNVNYHWTDLRRISSANLSINGAPAESIQLPTVLTQLRPGDRLVVTFDATTNRHDNLLFQVFGASLDIYINQQLYLSTGQPNSFPAFQKTPPPQVSTLAMPSFDGLKSFRLEYTIAAAGSTLTLQPLYLGDSTVLFLQLLRDYALVLVTSVLTILVGLSLTIMALLAIQAAPAASRLAWLGLSCLAFGVWSFCGNGLAIYLMPMESLLYTLYYIGLLLIVQPLVKFYQLILDRPDSRVLNALKVLAAVVVLAAITLHLSSVWPFVVSGPVIRLFAQLALVVLSASCLVEYARSHISTSRLWIGPTVLIGLAAGSDLVNVQWLHSVWIDNILQFTFLIFTIWLAIIVWLSIRRTLEQASFSQQLSLENDVLLRDLEKQQELYQRLAASAEQVRTMRHDFRHQLAALRAYLQAQDTTGALEYINQLSAASPSFADLTITDNFAVNAV